MMTALGRTFNDDKEAHGGLPLMASFRFVAVGDLECAPPEFLVSDLIEVASLGLLFGTPGCGKSFLAVDLALSIATGRDFHGYKVKQGSVFYIAGEGHSGLARRINAWSTHKRISLKGVPMFKSERAAQFLDGYSARAVTREVQRLADAGGAPALIIIDTMARNFGPGDENSTSDMAAFIAAMDELRANWPKCTIMIVHHSGHADRTRARGAIALKGAVDFEYLVQKNGPAITLTNTKMKDAELSPVMAFVLQPVEIESGVSIPVLVGAIFFPLEAKVTGQAEIALRALDKAIADHGEVKHGEGFPADRPCVAIEHWRNVCEKRPLSGGESPTSHRSAFSKAKTALENKGLIRAVGGFVWRADQ